MLSSKNGIAIFSPTGTNYEMHLGSPAFAGPIDIPVKGIIRVAAQENLDGPQRRAVHQPHLRLPGTIQTPHSASSMEMSMIIHAGTCD